LVGDSRVSLFSAHDLSQQYVNESSKSWACVTRGVFRAEVFSTVLVSHLLGWGAHTYFKPYEVTPMYASFSFWNFCPRDSEENQNNRRSYRQGLRIISM
jgi:hypothetical protein